MPPTLNEKLTLGILHYHWRKGGVYTVVLNTLKALLSQEISKAIHVDLISCDAKQDTGVSLIHDLTAYAQQCSRLEFTTKQIAIPQLGYQDKPHFDRTSFVDEAETLRDSILRQITLNDSSLNNPYVLYAHNANLGKNPCLTYALKEIAVAFQENNHPAWILNQMHDFPEDHRPACWAALTHCTGRQDTTHAIEMMYPNHSRLRWATINSADKDKLELIGLPQSHLTVLPNSVESEIFKRPAVTSLSMQELKETEINIEKPKQLLLDRIDHFAKNNGFQFCQNRKIILSPVKMIRRKNIIESILYLLKLNEQKDQYQLIITLGANSPQDRDYCDSITQFVKEHQLPIVIGFGEKIGGFHAKINDGKIHSFGLLELFDISEFILTTSIQEGFGYVFHEPWLAGKMVLGRNIEMVTRDFRHEGLILDLYEQCLIPQDWIESQWSSLCKAYCEKIDLMRQEAGLDPWHEEKLSAQVESAKCVVLDQVRYVDFANCSSDLQFQIISKVIKAPESLNQVIYVDNELNKKPDWYLSHNSDMINSNIQAIKNKYGLASNADRFMKLLQASQQNINQPVKQNQINNRMIFEQSLSAENIRLLI